MPLNPLYLCLLYTYSFSSISSNTPILGLIPYLSFPLQNGLYFLQYPFFSSLPSPLFFPFNSCPLFISISTILYDKYAYFPLYFMASIAPPFLPLLSIYYPSPSLLLFPLSRCLFIPSLNIFPTQNI